MVGNRLNLAFYKLVGRRPKERRRSALLTELKSLTPILWLVKHSRLKRFDREGANYDINDVVMKYITTSNQLGSPSLELIRNRKWEDTCDTISIIAVLLKVDEISVLFDSLLKQSLFWTELKPSDITPMNNGIVLTWITCLFVFFKHSLSTFHPPPLHLGT